MNRTHLVLAGFLAWSALASAVEMPLDRSAISQAIAIGQSRLESDRARFHRPYRLDISKPPIDYIDVITPFRRVVVEAEKRANIGDRSFGQRQGLELLQDIPERLELWIELTFHPLNTYVLVPEYQVVLIGANGTRIEAQGTDRVPRYGPRVNASPFPTGLPGPSPATGKSQPMAGATMYVRFDGRMLDKSGTYDATIAEGSKELVRAKVDFGKLR